MAGTSKGYNTRQKRKSHESMEKSRIDWKRTKVDGVSHVLDSDELSTSEEDVVESSSAGESEEEQSVKRTPSADSGEDDGHIKKPRHKSAAAALPSSDSSDSSDFGPIVRKVNCKPWRVIQEDDQETFVGKVENRLNPYTAQKDSVDEESEAHDKKRKRLENLQQLAEKRRSRCRTSSREPLEEKLSSSDMNPPLIPETLSETEDSDDMANFIEPDDEESKDEKASCQELFEKHNLFQFAGSDLYSHLQKVIRALLINKVDNEFLRTLYEGIRDKRYAKDLLKSLNYLEERIIAPRLEKLTTSCRWSTSYKERVNCYPRLYIKCISFVEKYCDACKLRRHCRFMVKLSGQAYDKKILQNDDFLPHDKQILFVGAVCASRTQVYHRLQHYKYFLYRRCAPFLDELEDVPAKELVDRALSKMEEDEFINKEVNCLEGYLHEADYFQEENLESLFG